ncbi:S-adenosyl-L-methionine-dependent tRNA 4-demethylwyosine synthase TYW1 isoform X2 [Hydra vulgaris]|uniref:tRNA 4-demethylwyosine synthase (AdoMet-dependent) n=1 Tax=Hydra vulgaris TaxID=6087 RepID=A0ABM4CQZ0_HYDVU
MKALGIFNLMMMFLFAWCSLNEDEYKSDTWQYDFVMWWSYAKFPLATFVLASTLTTWLFIYFNRDRFQLKGKHVETENTPFKVYYGTQTGNAKYFSEIFKEYAESNGIKTSVINMKNCEPEEVLLEETDGNSLCVFIISTYMGGSPPDSATWFCTYLKEASDDFRVQKNLLKGLKYTVFGLGNSIYEDHYNTVAISLDKWLHKLYANKVFPLGLGDENVSRKEKGTISDDFTTWMKTLVLEYQNSQCFTVENESISEKKVEEEKKYESESEDESTAGSGGGGCKSTSGTNGIIDVEDIGKVINNQNQDEYDESFVGEKTAPVNREMVTPLLKKSLEKQGYKIIGSHSGVKICRWTKSMMRGRGGCYKHTFYGIESHRCMETTPSLACANKCVFCWRHHTNPVGTEWKWAMDDPNIIVEKAMENHYKMIKQFKGVPGVKLDRFQEAMDIQHCALSLVGEPIMYPEINKLINLLHGKKISTFLVTNAQFPDAIKQLKPVTQLYVSVDAATKESLKRIDRPLFRDYWQRFLDSLSALSEKGQRTVYRLTLVKAFNTEEIESYAKLVSLGQPGFIEVKGVTYCGESKASSLTMENIPWHEEVVSFVKTLAESLPDYELASEHEHSNCVLLCHKRFKINNKWHTWIDYAKYHELIKAYEDSNGKKTFSDMDYLAPTPEWAVFGDDRKGFDPNESRWHRKKKKDISGC